MSNKTDRVVICPYCGRQAEYADSATFYGKSYGKMYICRPCAATVGVHSGTTKPLGTLAKKELRALRIKAHRTFDALWMSKVGTQEEWEGRKKRLTKSAARGWGYAWLAQKLGVEKTKCHIGLFDKETCRKVLEACEQYNQKATA